MDNYKKYVEKMKKLKDPRTYGLLPLEEIIVGERVFWFYPQTQNKEVVIASEPLEMKVTKELELIILIETTPLEKVVM